MIRVRFYQDSRTGAYGMTIRGHAGAAPRGEDLVCCAASTLAYTAAQAAKNLQAQGYVAKNPKIKIKTGNATVIATPSDDGEHVREALLVCQGGMQVLEANYPMYIRIEEKL